LALIDGGAVVVAFDTGQGDESLDEPPVYRSLLIPLAGATGEAT
jgi:hypothetical protein